jgi:ATP-binding cassette subfamily B protein
MTSKTKRSLWLVRRLLEQTRPYWRWIGLLLVVSLLATPLALLQPLPVMLAVDSVLGSQPPPGWLDAVVRVDWADPHTSVVVVSALVVVFAFLSLFHQMALMLLRTFVGEKLVMSFRERLFRHAQRLSLTYHDRAGSADSVYRIQSDAASVQSLVLETFVPMISAVVMVASMLVVTAQVNLRLALIGLAVCPPLILTTAAFRPRLRRQWHEVKALESTVQSVVQEVLGSVRVVKAFGREEHEASRFRSHYRRGVAARLEAAVQENAYAFLTGMIVAVGTAAVLWVGVVDVRSGELPLGSLLLVMAYLKHLYSPLKTIGRQLTSRQKALASAERTFRLLDEVTEVAERPDALPLRHAAGRVSFRNVSFAYPGAARMLANVTFEVPAGTSVGIFGPSGAGKTTLLNLLTRFYDPVDGEVLLDGVDLRDVRVDDLRRQFSVVLQEPVLFSTSIAENIAYGRLGASEAEIIEAARIAGVHELIESLPDGYRTLVGERGMRLSGGERQRISLARAFLKDAPILILDEPTSSVDQGTELGIMTAMERLMQGRTTFMIAHRISTLRNCGLLLRVEDGAVRVATRDELDDAVAPATVVEGKADAKSDDPRAHEASIAWRVLEPDGDGPSAISLLKGRPNHKSAVFRLHDVLPGKTAVVGKRALRETGVVERLIYEVVLPSLPLSGLEVLGAVDEGPGARTMWLFMQDVGDTWLAADQHILLAQWLAQLHTSAVDSAVVRAADLPDRGLEHYYVCLERTRRHLREQIVRWASMDRASASAVLTQNLEMLDQLHARWATFVALAEVMPPTLVHGDIVPKNVRVADHCSEPGLYVLDWEMAGWGSPAVDLACLSVAGFKAAGVVVDAYATAVRRRWPAMDAATIEQARRVGIVMRWINAIDWATYSLGFDWNVPKIERYAVRLRSALGPSEGLGLL